MELILLLKLSEGIYSIICKSRIFYLIFRKRWLLFPPDSPIGQLQTRIPYEESSVYIDIEPNILDKFKVNYLILLSKLKIIVEY